MLKHQNCLGFIIEGCPNSTILNITSCYSICYSNDNMVSKGNAIMHFRTMFFGRGTMSLNIKTWLYLVYSKLRVLHILILSYFSFTILSYFSFTMLILLDFARNRNSVLMKNGIGLDKAVGGLSSVNSAFEYFKLE